MRKSSSALIFLVICLLSVGALADWDPCCPCPNTKWVQLPDPTGWDVRLTTPKILADDFICTETGWITDIHFWGSWKGDVVGVIDNIHLSIHADIPDGGQGFSIPGAELWSVDIDPDDYAGEVKIRDFATADQGWYDPNLTTDAYIRHDHDVMVQVNVFLAEEDWWIQRGTLENPVVYWLDIQVDVSSPAGAIADFGWKTSYEHKGPDDAVWGDWGPNFDASTVDGIDWHELIDPIWPDESLDMAFVITGIPIPEPGIVALSGLGLLALLARRRKK
jgi:hypothetical protein